MNRLSISLSLSLAMLVTATSLAQVGENSGLWKWTKKLPHHESIVEVSSQGGSGTGVVISVNKSKPVKDGFEGYVLTAWHVIQDDIDDSKVKVSFRNGRRSKGCKVHSVQRRKRRRIAVGLGSGGHRSGQAGQ